MHLKPSIGTLQGLHASCHVLDKHTFGMKHRLSMCSWLVANEGILPKKSHGLGDNIVQLYKSLLRD
jgi:hypothetical protein